MNIMYGNNRGIFTLPNSDISSFLSGGTVLDGNQITLQRENAGGYSASQSIYLWGTTHTSASGSAPPLTKNYGYLGTLAWGERKTFTLPKTFVSDLKAGTIKSVMFYTSDGSNYIKFSAVCALRLKVNKAIPGGGTGGSGGSGGTDTPGSITISKSTYTIQNGESLKVNYTSTVELTNCMLLFAPNYSDSDCIGGNISNTGEFTFYTSSKEAGTYTVKVRGRKWNDSTSSYVDSYSNTFTLIIGGGSEEPITPITISNINDITVNSGSTFNIVYTTNVDAVRHEISLDGGNSYNTIHPTGDKNGYTYQHEALTSTSSPYQGKIRVTDANNNTATSNTFSITVNSSSSGGDTSNDIVISQDTYEIQAGQDVNVRYTSSINISTCMLLFAPNYDDTNYTGGYISSTGVFTFYTSSRSAGTYTVKVKGRKFNDSTQTYDDYYSNTFTLIITDNTGGGGSEEPTTPITISNIDNITVDSGTTFNIVYRTNVDAVKHEISLDGGGIKYTTIYPTGDKNGYVYQHEALTESRNPYQRLIRVTDASGNTATSNTFNITVNAAGSGGEEPITPITISDIDDITVNSGSTFNIVYMTNIDAVKHEMSFDGGSSYNVIYPSGDKYGYTYQHEALTISDAPYQRLIRVTDANGNTATSNKFYITVNSSSGGGDTSNDITISQSNYTIQVGQDVKVNYTSSIALSTCMLLYAPDYNDNNYSGGYISATGEFTFYTSSKSIGTYTVKVKGRKFNDSTQVYDNYYSNTFTITITDNTSGGGGSEEPTTPIVINNISDMTVNSGSPFNIVYTTNVDAVSHEMSFDGGNSYNVIYPTGDKNGYTYQHEALTETSYPHQRVIRVRDANGNTATSNIFNITVSSGSSGGGGSTKSPFLVSMYGDPRVIPNYPSGIQFPPINAHEDGIQPNGVNSTDSWKYGTRINLNPRNDWTRVGFWGQVYRQEGYGYDPDNVGVEVTNAKLWGWNGSSWVLIHDVSFTASNTIFYVENFANDQNNAFASNKKVDGSKNVTIKFDSTNSGYMFHPYSGKARADDYGLPTPYYYCSTMSARLVKWDSSGADNLDNAKLCFNVGGDFWHTTYETWQPDWSANGEYAQGQFIKCTREWRTAYATNVPESWGNGFPITDSTGGGGGETTTPITINNISDMTVNSGSVFNITYTTNVDAVKHEMSFDGGSTFNVIYPSGDKNGYTYQHEALTETSYPHQRKIRVTDANGNTATSNTFSITVSSGGTGGGSGSGGTSNDITLSQSSYTIQTGQDLLVNYTSSVELSTCILLFAPNYDDTNYVGGYISSTGVFTFYTSSRSAGTYSVKVKGRKFNDSTQVYDDYYSDVFTLIIADSTSGGGSEEPTTPITINNISDMTVNSGSPFNIVYTTNVDAVRHEMSFDGGSTFNVIYPTGDKNGYTYQHEALTETSYPHQRIVRVTDANNNTATSNTFSITVNSSGSGGGSGSSNNITISQSSYSVEAGVDVKVNYTSSIALSTCMLLYAPDYSESDGYSGGYISNPNEFTFYTSSKASGTYTVKVKGRKFNDSTNSYDDYYSNTFTLIIGGGSSSGGGETTTPITISNIDDMTVSSGSTFNIVYTTNVDATTHEMSFDGGSTFHVIYPSGDKNGYTYQHEALTETAYSHQRVVRVTDSNGNTATSNTFSITVSTSGGSSGGSTKSPFLVSMYGDPRVVPSYPSGIQFPPINAHEDGIQPKGVNSTDSWKYGTRINQSPRSDWTRVGWWGQVYRREDYGSDPDNVAVEIKDAKLWGWNGSSWVLIHDVSFTAYNTIFYVENFAGDSNNAFASNKKITGGKNATAKFDSVNSGYMWHPYSGKARADDYGLPKPYYYCSTMSARLVKWNESGADNLDSAKLCFNVGGDFWHTTHETWQPDWSANGEYAQGQFIKCTREWRTAYCTNVPESWGNGFPSL